MTNLKNISGIGAAAAVISLFSHAGAKAAEITFDGGARSNIPIAALKAQANADFKTPVPSTYTPSTELTNFWGNLTENTKDKICKAANIKINQGANIIPQIGIEGGLRREFKSYPDQCLALVDEISLKLNTSLGTEVLNVPNVGGVSVSIGGALEGKSMVVRPLEDNRYCKNLLLLSKLWDVKTAVVHRAQGPAAKRPGIYKL